MRVIIMSGSALSILQSRIVLPAQQLYSAFGHPVVYVRYSLKWIAVARINDYSVM